MKPLVQPNPHSLELVIDTVMNHIDPRLSLSVEAAAGRSLAEVTAQWLANYAPPGFDVEPTPITVAGVEAVLLDNLPGQDLNRRVIFIHNDRLYNLFFGPIGDEGDEVRRQADSLYRQTIESFRFLEVAASVPSPSPTDIAVLPADIEYVTAMVDIKIYSGPGPASPVIGDIFAGQTALVTGVTPDGQWRRVICPDDTVGDCFVSADPTLTQPAATPVPIAPE